VRVLIVSYYFPPAGGGGVQRVLKWCKYLPDHGIEVHVLAPDDPKWLDRDDALEVPARTVVHRTRNRSPRSLRPNEELARARGRVGRVARKARLAPRRLLLPDLHIGWAIDAVPEARRIVAEHDIDVIVSTSPPETAHVIAARVARQSGVPWVADFRDSWLDLPHLRLDRASVRMKHRANRRIAERTVGRAHALTTVSAPLAADLRRRHPHVPVHVVGNGVDLHDVTRAAERAPQLRAADERTRGRFLILYTGNFFGRQSPRVLLDALERLVADDPTLPDRVVMRFVGGLKPIDNARIDASDLLRSIVDRVPFLAHEDVLAWQHAADLLLLYVAPGRGSEGVYTGKVFEYVASNTPVLALAPADNVAAQLVREADAGLVVAPDDVGAVATALRDVVEHPHQRAPLASCVRSKISREGIAAEFAALLTRVAQG
jgi:glycosyltransferase involved in cell wall biosynthesis